MKRLIIVGSPRTNGRSAHLAEMLFEANIDEHPEDELFLVPVSEVEIGPCVGCNACRTKSGVIVKGGDGQEVTLQKHRCVFDDDMQTLYDLIDDADEVTVVSPVYFSGAPASMKCVLDRLQPYFWARMELKEAGLPLPEKRPLTLHVLGEGGDPHGYGALLSEVKSAFATADFRLERVLDWVGKIDASGDILAEASEVELGGMEESSDCGETPQAVEPRQTADDWSPAPDQVASGQATTPGHTPASNQASTPGKATAPEQVASDRSSAPDQATRPRPKLNLHSGIRDDQSTQASSRQARSKARGTQGDSNQQSAKKPQGSKKSQKSPRSQKSQGQGAPRGQSASKGPKQQRRAAGGRGASPKSQGRRRGN